MENNKKVDIKSLLEQNNIKVNNNQAEDDVKNVLDDVPENFNPAEVENAQEGLGQVVQHEEMLKHTGVKGGGVPGNIISAEQMASIEETLRELEEETEAAKLEFEEFRKKQEEQERARKEAEAKESEKNEKESKKKFQSDKKVDENKSNIKR